MKYIMTLLVIITTMICFENCHSVTVRLTGTDSLETLFFRIPTDRDTTIETKGGALLNFPKGALDAGSSPYAEIGIKEAFTLEQIVLGGLTTTTNGIPLSSGGMIYINAKAGSNVKVSKPIRVALPATHLQEGMQLYKGETGKDGNIDWKDPKPLPPNPQQSIYNEGKALFEDRCSSCHNIGSEATGPDLAHFMRIFGPFSEGFIGYNPHGVRAQKDSIVLADTAISPRYDVILNTHTDQKIEPVDVFRCNLRHIYGSIGPESGLSNRDLEKVYNYIQQESDRLDLPLPFIASLNKSVDSCELYHQKVAALENEKLQANEKRNELIVDNGSLVNKNPDTTWKTGIIPLPPDFDQRVSPDYYDAVYYQFTIDSFGWYNIDMLMELTDGVQESELFVRIQGQYHDKIKVYLIIPSVKVYGEGGPAEKDPEAFAFFYKTGKIMLPQNAQAFILAISESESEASVVYGITPFRTARQQELNVTLHTATKAEFKQAVSEFEAGRLYFRVADTKNADSIRAKDTLLRNIDAQLKEAEKWKPKICDCDCGSALSAATDMEQEK